MIEFPCPRCERAIKAPTDLIGHLALCPKCRQRVTVPWPEPPAKFELAPAETVDRRASLPPDYPALSAEPVSRAGQVSRVHWSLRAILSLLHATNMAALLLIVGFFLAVLWTMNREDEEARAHGSHVSYDETRGFQDFPPPKTGEAEEAFKALQELVRSVLGPDATFGKHEPIVAQFEYLDQNGCRFWRFRGDRVAEFSEHAEHGRHYIVILWLEPLLGTWSLAWFNYGGEVLHDDRPREYRDYINSRALSDAQIDAWNRSYVPDRTIAVRRVMLYPPMHELDEETRQAIYPIVDRDERGRRLMFPSPRP